MNDYITPAERLRPPSKLERFIGRLWWRYRWRCDRWEYQKAKDAKAYEIAISWVESMEACERRLAELGVAPSEVESIQDYFELWLIGALLCVSALFVFLFSAYKGALMEIIQRSM